MPPYSIKLRKEMGNVTKRQQPDHRADNIRRPPMGLPNTVSIPNITEETFIVEIRIWCTKKILAPYVCGITSWPQVSCFLFSIKFILRSILLHLVINFILQSPIAVSRV